MPATVIPVFEPYVTEEDVEEVAEAVRRGEISGSFGSSIPNFESEFASYVGTSYGVAVSSGTAALQLAVAAAEVGPGDEVLVSASTNVATALAVYHNGAVPIAVDSEPETGNLDLDLLESLITPSTRAIIPVHLFGHPVDMDRLLQIVAKHELLVIEDAAEAHGATVRGRMAGSFGQMSCFSFYANKIVTTGEGGMVLTGDPAYAERLRLLRNLAFTEPRFVHEKAGFNFRMTGYQAALGRSQLKRVEFVIENKRRIATTYNRLLEDLPGIRTPIEKEWARNVYWMYSVIVEDDFPVSRDELMRFLGTLGIETRTHFCPMNLQPFLQRQPNFRPSTCPIAEKMWRSGMYLPSSILLSEEVMTEVIDAIRLIGGYEST
jgi:perosamine synthetase